MDLKPCPFCGGEAHIEHDDDGSAYLEVDHRPDCFLTYRDTLRWFYPAKGDMSAEEHAASEWNRRTDLIEPSYKPDAEYEAWYNNLSHFGDEQGGPSTIRELIEEIVWAALTVDLGPNGNTDPSTGVDEGDVYTNNLFAAWEREASRLSGGCDRDALLALADYMKRMPQCELCPAEIVDCSAHPDGCPDALLDYYARRIREALGVSDGD